uniref:Protein archease n=2 Tax=Cercopithecinae TaxID=9528 RepID=A0A2K5P7Q4_CERAT
MKGGSRVSNPAVMAQEEEDVRDYNLTEEQKAIKAKYPPVNRKYEYLDHTQTIIFKANNIPQLYNLTSNSIIPAP